MVSLPAAPPVARGIRVFLVDDSAVIRLVLRQIVSSTEDLTVVGEAANGAQALRLLEKIEADVVVLDVEMPIKDGVETLTELKQRWPHLPVIMFSTLTERGAKVTIEALARGAEDFVAKPSQTDREAARAVVVDELLPRLRALGRRRSLAATHVPVGGSVVPLAPRGRVDAIVVASSTGGPAALQVFAKSLPSTLPVPVLFVQHMPPMFTRLLADRLSTTTAIPVNEAVAGEPVLPGRGYVARGGMHLSLRRVGAQIVTVDDDSAQLNYVKPAADILFRAAAKVYGPGVLAIVLTGMGHDGRDGAQAVVAAGGTVIAQDEASSLVWGMPGAVVKANLAIATLPLADIGPAVVRQATGRR